MNELIGAMPAIAQGASGILGMGAWGLVLTLIVLLIRERQQRRSADNAEDRQRVELGIQMLEAAGAEISRLNAELKDARVFADVEAHLNEAERHLTALLHADPEDMQAATRGAMAFLNRMRRLRDARGVARNEMQIAVSHDRLGDGR